MHALMRPLQHAVLGPAQGAGRATQRRRQSNTSRPGHVNQKTGEGVRQFMKYPG